jgi:hypothetical protein
MGLQPTGGLGFVLARTFGPNKTFEFAIRFVNFARQTEF